MIDGLIDRLPIDNPESPRHGLPETDDELRVAIRESLSVDPLFGVHFDTPEVALFPNVDT